MITKNNLLFFCVFCIHGYIFWPGLLTPDSQAQYQNAIAGVYNDHHPIIMAVLWRWLLYISSGSAGIFVFHLVLLYGSVYYLCLCLPLGKKSYALLFPFIPSVFVYSGFIWKDISFAYSFLFIGSFLSFLNVNNYSLKWYQTIFLIFILFYGTLVKYQAQYCAFFLLIWVSYTALKTYTFRDHLKYFVLITGTFIFCVLSFNKIMAPQVQVNHSWQYVKIFDLAAISLKTDRFFIPDFMKTSYFTNDKFRKITNDQSVDDLIFPENAILKLPQTSVQRQDLKNIWWKVILQYPLIYLKHRLHTLAFTLGGVPGYGPISHFIQKCNFPEGIQKAFLIISRIMGYLFLSHFLQILGSILYVFISLRTLSITKFAIPLFFFNVMGISFTSALLFCSMAGTPRYTYGAICFFHASHFFAYRCYQALKNYKSNFN